MLPRGFSLIEIIVSVGLFTVIMTLASGAYLVMINVNRQAQSIATGINNLSFALETMVYNIRTGARYNCGGIGDCPNGSGSFEFIKSVSGVSVLHSYTVSGGRIQERKGSIADYLTDSSVKISSLTFYAIGVHSGTHLPPNDWRQPRVTIVVSGWVDSGHGKREDFTVEAGATMRGSDL